MQDRRRRQRTKNYLESLLIDLNELTDNDLSLEELKRLRQLINLEIKTDELLDRTHAW